MHEVRPLAPQKGQTMSASSHSDNTPTSETPIKKTVPRATTALILGNRAASERSLYARSMEAHVQRQKDEDEAFMGGLRQWAAQGARA